MFKIKRRFSDGIIVFRGNNRDNSIVSQSSNKFDIGCLTLIERGFEKS